MKSDRIDVILDAIDTGLQRPTIGDAITTGDVGAPGICWRCAVRDADGPAGVCPPCRALLLDDTYQAPLKPDHAAELARLLELAQRDHEAAYVTAPDATITFVDVHDGTTTGAFDVSDLTIDVDDLDDAFVAHFTITFGGIFQNLALQLTEAARPIAELLANFSTTFTGLTIDDLEDLTLRETRRLMRRRRAPLPPVPAKRKRTNR